MKIQASSCLKLGKSDADSDPILPSVPPLEMALYFGLLHKSNIPSIFWTNTTNKIEILAYSPC